MHLSDLEAKQAEEILRLKARNSELKARISELEAIFPRFTVSLDFSRISLHPQRFQRHFWSRVVWQEQAQHKDDELEELQQLYEAETRKTQNLTKEKQRQIAQKAEEEKNVRAAKQRLDTLVNCT